MPFTKHFRIDERLVHGQILKRWLDHNSIHRVLVIDDDISNDPFVQSVLTMTLPKKVTTDFLCIKDGIKRIKEEKEELLVLMKSIGTFWDIQGEIEDIKAVNICRLPYSSGKMKICENVYISVEEKKIIQNLIKEDIDVFIQAVPDDEAIHLKNILG